MSNILFNHPSITLSQIFIVYLYSFHNLVFLTCSCMFEPICYFSTHQVFFQPQWCRWTDASRNLPLCLPGTFIPSLKCYLNLLTSPVSSFSMHSSPIIRSPVISLPPHLTALSSQLTNVLNVSSFYPFLVSSAFVNVRSAARPLSPYYLTASANDWLEHQTLYRDSQKSQSLRPTSGLFYRLKQ